MSELSASPIDGVLLFAHGSRDPLWRLPIEAVALEMARLQPALAVRCAYLELCEPGLPEAASHMIEGLMHSAQQSLNTINSIALDAHSITAKGQKRLKIRILPMFLGMGKHARHDLPELASQLRQTHPQVDFEIAPAVGEDPRLTRLLAQLAMA
ncbi:MAG: cobalamin biosynthesis protein CbiX [Brachymonas sp.]|nr:cobalamin biosynthesis protein CbiX [Brachymonas sp.]